MSRGVQGHHSPTLPDGAMIEFHDGRYIGAHFAAFLWLLGGQVGCTSFIPPEGCELESVADLDEDQDGYFDLGDSSRNGCYCEIEYPVSFGEDDCGPGDPDVHPGAVEIPANRDDENCDGVLE